MKLHHGAWIFITAHPFNFLFLFLFLTGGLWWWFSIPDPLFIPGYSTVVYDRHHHLIGARTAPDGQWRFPVSSALPDRYKTALLAFEDQHFYYHPGVNPASLVRAIRQNIAVGGIKSGGSTITMQLIRMARKNPPRTITEKFTEILRALRLEVTMSKNEVLTYYAAHAPFGGNVVGLEAASWRYFHKPPDDLSWSEAAVLAVLPNAPGLIFPGKNQEILRNKRNRLLDKLHSMGKLDSLSCALAKAEEIPQRPLALPEDAYHITERLIREGYKGKAVVTTLDCKVQKAAVHMLERRMEGFRSNHIHNGAVLITDIHSGEVLCYIGNVNSDQNHKGQAVDVITAPRSPGSVLKPLLYQAALSEGEILPRSLLPDIPSSYRGYSPKNFNSEFEGAVPASNAISRSLNVPAVRLLHSFGVARFHHYLKKLGLTTLTNSPDHYGLSLILGGSEATLWDLSSIYGKLGNSLKDQPENIEFNMHFIKGKRGIEKATHLPDKGSIWYMLEAMADVSRPEEELNWRYFSSTRKIAWKTGTSFGYRDGWAIGLTPKYVVGVWIGNASGEGRPGLTGISTAGPVLMDIFRSLPGSTWFRKPSKEMKSVMVCKESGNLAGRNCDKIFEMYVPAKGSASRVCTYHTLIHLDSTRNYRVHTGCLPSSEQIHVPWFVLTPGMEWFYSKRHPSYRHLPPWLAGCGQEATGMEIIYPARDSEIFIPVGFDGIESETVFEAAHSVPGSEIHWHLDETYLGTTHGLHQIALRPSPGNHILTLVDENGNRLARKFSVIKRRNS